MSGAIEMRNFGKRFGEVVAVADLTLTVEPGELFGLIGPDGAGKTTTMRTICTLLICEQGEVLVDGLDVRTQVSRIRAILGYMPQRFSLYPDLTVAQNLRFFADLFHVPKDEQRARLAQLYKFSKLEPFKDRLARALSGGMKQKLALSCTLIHTPRILILDEPTTGVDPVSRREFWDILKQLRDDGVTILVSTPYMEEADLCDRVAFMYKGRVLALDKPQALPRHFPHHLHEVTGDDIHKIALYLREQTEARSVQIFGDRLHVSFATKPDEHRVAEIKEHAPVSVESFAEIEPSVEDTFLALMQTEAMEP